MTGTLLLAGGELPDGGAVLTGGVAEDVSEDDAVAGLSPPPPQAASDVARIAQNNNRPKPVR